MAELPRAALRWSSASQVSVGSKDAAIQDTVAQKPLVLYTLFSTFFNSDSNKGEKKRY